MDKKVKNTGLGIGLTFTALAVVGLATDRIEVVDNESAYSYAHTDAGWMSIDILGRTVFTSMKPFTIDDKLDREGYPLVDNDHKLYNPDTDIPVAALEPVEKTLKAKGIVCPENALAISYKPGSIDESTTTSVQPNIDASIQDAIPLRICIDYGMTAVKENTLMVPLTIEERTGIPLLDLSFKSVTDFCKDVSLRYSQAVNQELHNTKPLDLLLDNAQFDFDLVMSSSIAGPCDSSALNVGTRVGR